MGLIKDRYIHYKNAGDQFVGRSVTGISSLKTEFGVSPVHWYLIDSPVGSIDEMVALIEENFVKRIDVSSPTFELIQFLFACVRFNYTHLEMHIHKNHRLRASRIFIAAGRVKKFTRLLLPDIPGQARPTLPTLQEYLRMSY